MTNGTQRSSVERLRTRFRNAVTPSVPGGDENPLPKEDLAKYPALAAALHPRNSQFRAVAQARMYGQGPLESPHVDAAAMDRFYPALVTSFQRRYGVAEYHWCDYAPAAAVMTSCRRRLRAETHVWLFLNPGETWRAGESVLWKCDQLKDEVEDLLAGAERRRILRMVFGVSTTGLAELDRRSRTNSPVGPVPTPVRANRTRVAADDVADGLSERLGRVRAQFELAARRRMQLLYLFGMTTWAIGLGVAGVALLALADSDAVGQVASNVDESRRAVVCALSGTVGAFVSVLLRLANGRGVDVDVTLGGKIVLLVG